MKTLTYFSVLAAGVSLVAAPVRADDSDVMKMMPAVRALLGQLGKTDNGGQAQDSGQAQAPQAPQAPQAANLPPELMALLGQLAKGASDGKAAPDAGQAGDAAK